MNFQDISLINGYHAHVYFELETLEFAKALCEETGKLFSVTVRSNTPKARGTSSKLELSASIWEK